MTVAFHSALRGRIAKPLGFPGDQDRGSARPHPGHGNQLSSSHGSAIVIAPGKNPQKPDMDVVVNRSPHFAQPRRRTQPGLLSVVIPLFNESENVGALWDRLRSNLETSGAFRNPVR